MHDQENNREIIISKLESVLRQKYPRKLVFAFPNPEIIKGALLLPHPRLNIITSGVNRFTLPLRSNPVEISLKTGDSYFALPNAWEYQPWSTEFDMLCIVPRDDYLRVSFYHNNKNPHGIFYHTYRPYSEAFRHIIKALTTVSELEQPATAKHLAHALIPLALHECLQKPLHSEGKSRTTFTQLCKWVENNITKPINRTHAARVFNLSPSYVSQIFTKMAGMGFHQYLTQCRIELAKELLVSSNLTVYQVSDQCGFQNNVHFGKRFKEFVGIPPGIYRKIEKGKF